jgi:hypothetical protein
MPCLPQQKDSGAWQLNNRTSSGRRADHISSTALLSVHHHIVSAVALVTCRRGVVWSRRCQAYISVGGLLATLDGRRPVAGRSSACSPGGCGGAVAQVPAGEVVL